MGKPHGDWGMEFLPKQMKQKSRVRECYRLSCASPHQKISYIGSPNP